MNGRVLEILHTIHMDIVYDVIIVRTGSECPSELGALRILSVHVSGAARSSKFLNSAE